MSSLTNKDQAQSTKKMAARVINTKLAEEKGILPSLSESTNAAMIYTRLKNVENPNQTLRADKCGIPIANKAHTNPAIAIQYGSFITPSSLKRTYTACTANTWNKCFRTKTTRKRKKEKHHVYASKMHYEDYININTKLIHTCHILQPFSYLNSPMIVM